jgi:hypothetical protein
MTYPSTKPHVRKVQRMPPFRDASAPTATHATPSTPGDAGMRTSKRRQAEDITLVVVGTTIAVRIEARASTPLGPRVFCACIRSALFPPPPTNITRNIGETNPALWLEDYRLACRGGGAVDDDFIICNLPLFLANSARTWLEHLPAIWIHSWSDLREIFVGNFQGTYEHPENPWDLNNCRRKLGETLRE